MDFKGSPIFENQSRQHIYCSLPLLRVETVCKDSCDQDKCVEFSTMLYYAVLRYQDVSNDKDDEQLHYCFLQWPIYPKEAKIHNMAKVVSLVRINSMKGLVRIVLFKEMCIYLS